MSGTSMAAPEAAGIVALMLEANPALNPGQVRKALEVTARTIDEVPFFKQGYGYVSAYEAVKLSRSYVGRSSAAVDADLNQRHAVRDAAILATLDHPTRTWAWAKDVGTGQVAETHTIKVPAGTARVKAVVNGPSTIEVNLVFWDITITDARGQTVGASDLAFPNSTGTTILDIDLTDETAAIAYDKLAWGDWTMTVSSIDSLAPPTDLPDVPLVDDLPKRELDQIVSIFTAPPISSAPASVFVPGSKRSLRLQDDDASGVPFVANPDYTFVGPVVDGSLGVRPPQEPGGPGRRPHDRNPRARSGVQHRAPRGATHHWWDRQRRRVHPRWQRWGTRGDPARHRARWDRNDDCHAGGHERCPRRDHGAREDISGHPDQQVADHRRRPSPCRRSQHHLLQLGREHPLLRLGAVPERTDVHHWITRAAIDVRRWRRHDDSVPTAAAPSPTQTPTLPTTGGRTAPR